jgi:hypothetical protein
MAGCGCFLLRRRFLVAVIFIMPFSRRGGQLHH